MNITQLLNSGDFNLCGISKKIYGNGSKNRLNSIKQGDKALTDDDKTKLKNYFKENYQIILK